MFIKSRSFITIIFIAFSIALALWSHQYNTEYGYIEIENYSMEQVRLSMSRMQFTLEQALKRNLTSWARQEIVTMGLNSDHKILMLVNDQGKIIADKTPQNIGKIAFQELNRLGLAHELDNISKRINLANSHCWAILNCMTRETTSARSFQYG